MSWKLPRSLRCLPSPTPLVPPLGARLSAVFWHVPRGARVVDVGTDHAQLPRALVLHGRCPRAIGVDPAPGPLARAARTLEGIDGIELRAGRGLEPVAHGEADVAIFAGLGGETIAETIARDAPAELGLTRLVVQPNTEEPRVRRAIVAAGYSITEERFVADQDRFFLVLVADRDEDTSKLFDMESELLGPADARTEDVLFRAWLEGQVRWRTRRAAKNGRARDEALDVLARALHRLTPRD